jgi:hypothetical protein
VSALRAPVAVPVELRAHFGAGDERRVFRLSASVGEDGVRLSRPAPFEIGRPVEARFALPGGEGLLVLDAEILHADAEDERAYEESRGASGGRELSFLHASAEARAAIRGYVVPRLSLPA